MSRVPWQESNLSSIVSELDHKIKTAAADGEPQWDDLDARNPGIKIWRIEQFRVVPYSVDKYGHFHRGDSYVVLNAYTVDGSDELKYDLHIWIGAESSQDEYGTAAYKMVEADEQLGGAAVQHREVQERESDLFRSYFDTLKYLDGGVASGFRIVEPTKAEPHLYRVKGTERGMSLTQMPLSKNSLNKGDSFVLFADESTVWLWNGEGANPDEKARANDVAEKMCTGGTVQVLDQGSGDDGDTEFWAYLGEGEIQEEDDLDNAVEEFSPLLFKLSSDPDEEPEQVAKGELVKMRFGRPAPRLKRDSLDEGNVYLLDAGWELFLWIGSESDREEKLSAMAKADAYCREDTRAADLHLTLVKSGYENSDFKGYFFD